jgi:hypothetical protein
MLWIDQAAEEIAVSKLRAYFVPIDRSVEPANAKVFYLVVDAGRDFVTKHADAWSSLVDTESFEVQLFGDKTDKEPSAKWECSLVTNPQAVDVLQAHPVDEFDLVLKAYRPGQREIKRNPAYIVRTYDSRQQANVAWKTEDGSP